MDCRRRRQGRRPGLHSAAYRNAFRRSADALYKPLFPMVLWHQIHGPKSRIDGICPVIKPFGIAQERLRIDFRVEGQGADQLGFFSMMILVVVLARLSQSEANVLVEALVTQPAVKRFDES